MEKRKGYIKSYFGGVLRALVVALLLLGQFAIIFLLSYELSKAGLYIYYAIEVIMVISIIGLLNKRASTSFKFGWLFIIAVIPLGGAVMYLLWGRERSTKKIRKKSLNLLSYGDRYLDYSDEAKEHLSLKYPGFCKLVNYLEYSGFPLAEGNEYEYYNLGERAFDAVLEDMEKAKKFIFLNFFIVADGELWNRVKPVVLKKVSSGVEVRFLYDDFGSMFRTDRRFWKELEDAGVKVACFNPIGKYIAKLYLNYRDHQKMIIIDGHIGYTGGFNLADEYVNEIERFGHWKDGGVRIEGPGVVGMTITFLNMWGITKGKNSEAYSKYIAGITPKCEGGFSQFIMDGPENNPANPIASTINQLIYTANEYLYITTPYLLLEDDMSDALIQAAQAGVDVRIITPAIPDKRFVFLLTKYNYGKLLGGGVRIFEYTPGFVHAKNIITKDAGIIGTINLDSRSLYLHYECGAVIYDATLMDKVKKDFENTFEVCREISYKEWLTRPRIEKLCQWFFNIFSGLA